MTLNTASLSSLTTNLAMIGRGRPGVASLFCDLPTRWTAHAWNRISPRLSFADHFLEPVIDDVLAVFASTLGDCVHKTQIFSSRIVLKRFSWASLKPVKILVLGLELF